MIERPEKIDREEEPFELYVRTYVRLEWSEECDKTDGYRWTWPAISEEQEQQEINKIQGSLAVRDGAKYVRRSQIITIMICRVHT
jgi:peptide deformylase